MKSIHFIVSANIEYFKHNVHIHREAHVYSHDKANALRTFLEANACYSDFLLTNVVITMV